jgi:hypothetical protein
MTGRGVPASYTKQEKRPSRIGLPIAIVRRSMMGMSARRPRSQRLRISGSAWIEATDLTVAIGFLVILGLLMYLLSG